MGICFSPWPWAGTQTNKRTHTHTHTHTHQHNLIESTSSPAVITRVVFSEEESPDERIHSESLKKIFFAHH